MRGINRNIAVLLVLITIIPACAFKSRKYSTVMSYRDGRVFLTQKRYYRVGELPEGWERMNPHTRAISFYSASLKSSISTNAFCGKSIASNTREFLAGDAMSVLSDRRLISETNFDLDGRGALRRLMSGKVDGVAVKLDFVTVSKDGCVFDMYSVGPVESDGELSKDFEDFFNGFHY